MPVVSVSLFVVALQEITIGKKISLARPPFWLAYLPIVIRCFCCCCCCFCLLTCGTFCGPLFDFSTMAENGNRGISSGIHLLCREYIGEYRCFEPHHHHHHQLIICKIIVEKNQNKWDVDFAINYLLSVLSFLPTHKDITRKPLMLPKPQQQPVLGSHTSKNAFQFTQNSHWPYFHLSLIIRTNFAAFEAEVASISTSKSLRVKPPSATADISTILSISLFCRLFYDGKMALYHVFLSSFLHVFQSLGVFSSTVMNCDLK